MPRNKYKVHIRQGIPIKIDFLIINKCDGHRNCLKMHMLLKFTSKSR